MLQPLQLKRTFENPLLKSSIIYLPGFILLIYLIVRAIILPITVDENWTCSEFVSMSVIDIITYAHPIPNNHIVNTLLIKLTTQLFGWNQFFVRLPNILGFVVYYLSVLGILRKKRSDWTFVLFGIVVLVCNQYLLDFFSLARGYGLSIAFMFAAIYFMICYLEANSVANLFYASGIAAIAVYTNFTILNFYVAFSGLLFVLILLEYKTVSWEGRVNKMFIVGGVSAILFALSYLPITKMIATNQFVHWGTSGFYKDTIESLLTYTFYYYGGNNYVIPIIAIAALLGAIFTYYFLLILPTYWKGNRILLTKPFQIFPLLFIGTVIVNIAQHKIAGTPYLTTRTALFLYPLFALSIVGLAEYLYEKKGLLYGIIVYGFVFVGIANLSRTYNFYSCAEWWFDADTKDIISFLETQYKQDPQKKPIVLNTNWLFASSFDFYLRTQDLSWIKYGTYKAGIDSDYDYYYADSEEYNVAKERVEVVKSYNNSRFLVKKKSQN